MNAIALFEIKIGPVGDLETYLFDTVSPRFTRESTLNAFDFFRIIIWSANRSKTKVVKQLLAHGDFANLEVAVKALLYYSW